MGADIRPVFLTPAALAAWIPQLREAGQIYKFYKTPEWLSLRGQVLRANHYECEDCRRKSPTVIEQATCVHHDREVEYYPELALATFYIDEHGRRQQQLHALCSRCHNARHNRFGERGQRRSNPLTPERW